ncbi:MAG: LemA family protein [Candidatus Paceibacterota bacterium]
MNKALIIITTLLGIILITVAGIYNNQINNDENANKSWGDVEATYQRRADLIPSLVETVKGYAAHEKETLQAVTEARQQVTNIQAEIGTAGELDAAAMQKLVGAQEQMSSALSRLLVTVEKYPDLKANQNFLDLQHQLEGTENRINVARQRYNADVAALNKSVRGILGRMVSGMSGVNVRQSFEATAGSEIAPKVSFQ